MYASRGWEAAQSEFEGLLLSLCSLGFFLCGGLALLLGCLLSNHVGEVLHSSQMGLVRART